MTALRIAAVFWALLLAGVARADTADVTPSLVCSVQHAIRWRQPAWPDWMCLRVSDAVNNAAKKTGQRPRTILAIAINESDLRPGAEHWYGQVKPGSSGDLGLMGIRCILGRDMLCSNGALRGWKYPAAMALENNVLLGARILANKRTLNDYNGGEGYADRIRAISAALVGVRVQASSKRVRKLIEQILVAIARTS